MNKQSLVQQFEAVDARITHWMARHGITFLRISMGIIFVWFGALKLFPELSPAEPLIKASITFFPLRYFMPVLAIWEVTIGLGFLSGKFMRATILLLFLQMPGTLSPIVLAPSHVWETFPFGLTLAGQYMVKNLVLISAGLVIGSTVRGGGLAAEPDETPEEVRKEGFANGPVLRAR